MKDAFGRTIDYLRISVTDRCNLRCRYCMPAEGTRLLQHEDILSFETIVEITRCAVGMGVRKVRLTGGEPLVRRDIESLVRMLVDIPGIEDLGMTTNGLLLAAHAEPLARAGLHRINISLDTLDGDHFRWLTRGGDIRRVLDGIDAALAANLTPVKLNCVVGSPSDEAHAAGVRQFGLDRDLEVRVIRLMDFRAGRFSVVEGGTGGDCPRCNRLRLLSNGNIRPCLFSDATFSVQEFGPAEAIRRAIAHKPASGRPCAHNWMHRIGG